MAGLLTARVLSEHFDEIVLIERDPLEDTRKPRKGVPQGQHLHALLKKGEEIMSGLFPDLVPALIADGGTPVDFGRDMRWYQWGTWKACFDSGLEGIFLSRPLLEQHVRRRVLALPNLRRLDRHEAAGLVASPDSRSVVGVRVKPRGGEAETMAADLVVDACGRGSRTPKWLESLGYPRPEESTVKVHVKYATRVYRRPPSTPYAWKVLYVMGKPPLSRRVGAIAPIEGDRWIVTLVGSVDDHPPDDEAGFLEFARGLPVSDLYCALTAAEPLGDIASYRFPAHLRRHYERTRPFPERFVVLGDSACSFSPLYGQGMTTAGLGALALGRCVVEQRQRRGSDLTGMSRRFQTELARLTDGPWDTATGEDLRHPGVEGKRPLISRLLDPYLTRAYKVSGHDTEVLRAFYRAMHMLDGPSVLLRPGVVLRVLRG